ncbi:uncharacterized protein LOC135352460 [Halichondria panicea]|uniref:uncharacterized protein LOC135352460 n=1 Tax=Halichondria panicea TaxID=6063 RepID=UPI00312BA118
MNRTPNIRFSPVGGQVDTAISNSPYILSIPRKNDIYNFTVSVRNVAGETLQDASDFRVSAFSVDTSTITTCLTFTVREDCANDIRLGNFAILLSYGVGPCQSVTDFPNPTSMTAAITSAAGVCIPVETVSIVELCYTATLMYQNTAVMSQTNLDFRRCVVSTLQAQLGSGVTFTFNRAPDSSETVPHTTIATLECGSVVMTFSGDSQAICVDSEWMVENNSCSIAVSFMVVFIIVPLLVIFAVVVTIVVLVLYQKLKNKEGSSRPVDVEIDGLTKTPPPPYSIYADPNSIDIEDPDEIKSVPHTQTILPMAIFSSGHIL